MKKASRIESYRLSIQAAIAKTLCQEQAIDCGYSALAAAIEGQSWQRNRYMNLMRRFGSCSKILDSWTKQEEKSSIK